MPDLSRSLPTILRAFVPTWLAALGVLALGGTATASACHAPDRPALGLSMGWEPAPSPVGDRPDAGPGIPQFRPRPCPGEQPGSTPRSTVAASEFVPGLAEVLPPPAASGPSAGDRPDPPRPDPLASRLDRPPRPVDHRPPSARPRDSRFSGILGG